MSQSYRYQAMSSISSIEKITPQTYTLQKEKKTHNLVDSIDDIDEGDIIMCHESYLHIINHQFVYHHHKPLTTNHILDVVYSCIPSDTNRTYHNTLIDHITHNGQESQYCIGKTGKIECTLHMISIRSDLYHHLKHKKLTRYPQSRSSLMYVQHMNKKTSYCMLYIYEHSLKLLLIQDWYIYQVYSLSIWSQDLKKIYQEQHIDQYFDKSAYDYELNDFVKNIINKSVEFFATHIMRWMQDCIKLDMTDCYCICDTSNHFLKEHLTQQYLQQTTHNLIYINHVDLPNMYHGHLIDIGLYHTSSLT